MSDSFAVACILSHAVLSSAAPTSLHSKRYQVPRNRARRRGQAGFTGLNPRHPSKVRAFEAVERHVRRRVLGEQQREQRGSGTRTQQCIAAAHNCRRRRRRRSACRAAAIAPRGMHAVLRGEPCPPAAWLRERQRDERRGFHGFHRLDQCAVLFLCVKGSWDVVRGNPSLFSCCPSSRAAEGSSSAVSLVSHRHLMGSEEGSALRMRPGTEMPFNRGCVAVPVSCSVCFLPPAQVLSLSGLEGHSG